MKIAFPLSLAAALLFGGEVSAQKPVNGTLDVNLANPIGDTYPYRASGTLSGMGDVTARGWFIWDKDAGAITNALLLLKDIDGDTLFFAFGGFVSEDGQILSAGFEALGGTGKWAGVAGIGTINGSIVAPAQFNLRGHLFD
jgi:hypothetical protein